MGAAGGDQPGVCGCAGAAKAAQYADAAVGGRGDCVGGNAGGVDFFPRCAGGARAAGAGDCAGIRVNGAGGIGGGIYVGISTLPKVRLLMTLEARPGSGISQELIESTKLHIDTVFSTKMYKAD